MHSVSITHTFHPDCCTIMLMTLLTYSEEVQQMWKYLEWMLRASASSHPESPWWAPCQFNHTASWHPAGKPYPDIDDGWWLISQRLTGKVPQKSQGRQKCCFWCNSGKLGKLFIFHQNSSAVASDAGNIEKTAKSTLFSFSDWKQRL